MLPDSMVAQANGSAHTKTTCTVKGALHPHFAEPVIAQCKKCPFSTLCEMRAMTMMRKTRLLVQFWDDELVRPVLWFFDI